VTHRAVTFALTVHPVAASAPCSHKATCRHMRHKPLPRPMTRPCRPLSPCQGGTISAHRVTMAAAHLAATVAHVLKAAQIADQMAAARNATVTQPSHQARPRPTP
jgi:hypothetical protein